MDEFLDWLKEETLAGVWSKGVALSRNSKSVERLSSKTELKEQKFKILTTERVLAFTVTLWPEDQDAHCSCDSKVEPCHHVVAVALAIQNGLINEPGSINAELAPFIRYTWVAESGGMNGLRKLSLKRELVVNSVPRKLEGSLIGLIGGIQSGRIKMSAPSTTLTDLKIDKLYARAQVSWSEIFKLLAELPPLPSEGVNGRMLRARAKPLERKILVEDAENAAVLVREENSGSIEESERFQQGLERVGDELRVISNSQVPVLTQKYRPAEFEAFLRVTLPELKNQFQVEISSQNLPDGVPALPHISLPTQALGAEIVITASIAYPDPGPGKLALRNLSEEQKLLKVLREEFFLKPGVPAKFSLKSAVELKIKADERNFSSSQLNFALDSYFQSEAGLSLEQALREKEVLLKLLGAQERGTQPKPAFLEILKSLSTESTLELGRSKPASIESSLWDFLRDYQRAGVDWLNRAKESLGGAVLADDMGLGKTVQTLAVLQAKSLVVVPTSLLRNWQREAMRFRPELRVQIYHGPQRVLDPEADLVITSYAILRQEAERFAQIQWDTVVLDEAHTIRNPETQAAIASFRLQARARIALTRTPIQNRRRDLLSLFQFIRPGLFHFEEELEPRLIAPYFLRRTKDQVLTELPPKIYLEHLVQLSESERKFYDTVWSAAKREIVEQLDSPARPLQLFEVLLRARQACDHRDLIEKQNSEVLSSKLEALLSLLNELTESGQSVLVYSQWTQFLDLIETQLKPAFAYQRLDGTTADRGKVVDEFQASATPSVFLLSLQAGGVGLNLTRATQAVFCEPWWNPFVELQAEDRAYRMGQAHTVTVHRLICEDTLEEKMRALQLAKRELGEAVFQSEDLKALL